tara:strand:- start:48 stop:296 length:249 start_codon:yes stop_codon:yes gene_type:complete
MAEFMNFTVYTKQGCPFCNQVINVLREAEFKHVVYELDRDFDKNGFYGQFGEGSTFPQVVLDSTNLGGCQETVKYLRDHSLV